MIDEFDVKAGEDGVAGLLRAIGEDPQREGLRDTPKRVAKALREMTSGQHEDIAQILKTTFDGGDYDEVITVNNIDFVSMCEHHLLPFSGKAFVAYLPGAEPAPFGTLDIVQKERYRVVGLSKIPRLVDAFARRLQLQEQMTSQIAEAMNTHLQPRGVAVMVTAGHSCMSCRGVRKAGATMVTSKLLGAFKTDQALRAEVFRLFDK